MRRFKLYLLLIATVLPPDCYAQISGSYEQQLSTLNGLLAQWKESEAPEGLKSVVVRQAELLAALIESDPCLGVDDALIEANAKTLASFTNRMSYPCQGITGSLDNLRRDTDTLARELAEVAQSARLLASPPEPIDSGVAAVVEGDPAKDTCALELSYVTERANAGRFSRWSLAAKGIPAGGQFEWTVGAWRRTESGSVRHGVDYEELETQTRSGFDGKEYSLSYLKDLGLYQPTPSGYYTIEIIARYLAPNGAVCGDTVSFVLP